MNEIDDELYAIIAELTCGIDSDVRDNTENDVEHDVENDVKNDTETAGDSKNSDEEAAKKPFADVLDWVSCMVFAVAAMLALNLFCFRSITVSGPSMNNTLTDGDKVISTNFFYTPQYGDVVIVQANKLQNKFTGLYGEPIIKRVIAMAGDTIRIDYVSGEVYRNGELLTEDYIKELTHMRNNGWVEDNVDYVVPDNCVFVMGDNRNVSNDSRNLEDVGFIDVDFIMGKAIFRFSPIKQFKWL